MGRKILFITTDQQRYDTIRELGYDYVDTPNLDRLFSEGVTFTNCHVTAASCAPARASLFKGYYPHTTGILKNATTWRRSWIELLNEAGYHCTNVGKMHTWPFETPLGFDERYVVENKDRYLEGAHCGARENRRLLCPSTIMVFVNYVVLCAPKTTSLRQKCSSYGRKMFSKTRILASDYSSDWGERQC